MWCVYEVNSYTKREINSGGVDVYEREKRHAKNSIDKVDREKSKFIVIVVYVYL